MEQPDEIRCPKCNSNQLTANKKGFSGSKAIVGGLLTGGIGLLAGTIGSNKVMITCLACGNVFKPGEGKTNKQDENVKPIEKVNSLTEWNEERKRLDSPEHMEERLLKILREGFVRGAVGHYQKTMNVSETVASEYVEKFIIDHNLSDKVKRSGCFIATACYGDYHAPEVLVLRKYRDEHLDKTYWGRVFIEVYYLISPYVASIIERSTFLKNTITKFILKPIVDILKSR